MRILVLHAPKWVGGYVLKENIKRLKSRLKVWNKEQFRDTCKKVKQIQEELNKLEEETTDRQLSLQEVTSKKQLQEALWLAVQSHESLLRQKSKSRWIREGDCNSRYFHLVMNASRRNSLLKGIMIDGIWVDEPQKVNEAVREFFLQRFQESELHRPSLDGIQFQTSNQHQNDMLIGRFQEVEIKEKLLGVG